MTGAVTLRECELGIMLLEKKTRLYLINALAMWLEVKIWPFSDQVTLWESAL